MQANYMDQLMNKEKSEQLEALTKMMIVSFLWHTSGLMEPSKPTKTKQENTKPSQTNTEINHPEKK